MELKQFRVSISHVHRNMKQIRDTNKYAYILNDRKKQTYEHIGDRILRGSNRC